MGLIYRSDFNLYNTFNQEMKGQHTRWWQAILVVGGLILVVHQSLQVWKLVRAGDRIRQAQIELDEVRLENIQLQQKLVEVDNPGFIEKEAREKLGLGKAGEVVLIIPEQETNYKSSTVDSSSTPTWKQWWNLYIRL